MPFKAYAVTNRMDDALKNTNKELGNVYTLRSSK
jgi:hypothetical protein